MDILSSKNYCIIIIVLFSYIVCKNQNLKDYLKLLYIIIYLLFKHTLNDINFIKSQTCTQN